MLQSWLLPQMSEDSENFIFQQGRNPPHWNRDVRCFLNESLPQRWIGRVGKEDLALQFWPPKSPDLTPCEFFLWGFVKGAIYVPSVPTTLDELKKPYHKYGEHSDARHSSSGVERIQLPPSRYPCGRKGAH